MSRFFSKRLSTLTPYTPGEQPQDRQYIKLNTNESPFPPASGVEAAVAEASRRLPLYPDPDCTELTALLAKRYGVAPENVVPGNGSDEVLNFAFLAFCDEDTPAVFADITYGFYPVFARVNDLPYREIPLKADLSLDPADYAAAGGTIFIANPNAPTGLALTPAQIEQVLQKNPDTVVVVDEAYVDFGAESCVPLTARYDKLLVVQTFSKSRSLAGGRLGFGIGCEALIRDLHTIRYSTNPYNINRLTMAAGIATLQQDEYTADNCRTIMDNRQYTVEGLRQLGFEVTDSKTNFVFVKHPRLGGRDLYLGLKERGILVRHFDKPSIMEYNRITIGTRAQMEALLAAVRDILEE
ncbi:MAG: histidinol-phosphate transaminase [Clostridia bacterium]|nr:histidinol-phosphate transaminase [Clostridia bacterium]